LILSILILHAAPVSADQSDDLLMKFQSSSRNLDKLPLAKELATLRPVRQDVIGVLANYCVDIYRHAEYQADEDYSSYAEPLADLGIPASDTVIRLLDSRDVAEGDCGNAALRQSAALTREIVPILLNRINDKYSADAVDNFHDFSYAPTAPILAPLLTQALDGPIGRKMVAIRAIGDLARGDQTGYLAAIKRLIQLLDFKNPRPIRDQALEALETIGTPETLEAAKKYRAEKQARREYEFDGPAAINKS
jgi:HEAT repeat protein